MKIITFPFAGGNTHSFNLLQLDCLEVYEYPGRGMSVNELLLERIEDIITGFISKIRHCIKNEEYCIYGHSMGALVGYLFCVELEKLKLKLPRRLIVSGAKSPKYCREKILSNLPDKVFWEEVCKLGGIPEELNNHAELIEYFTPILKTDFRCIENYKYDKNTPKLSIPIDVFYGSDEDITRIKAEAWQEETIANVNVTELEGNHFFIFDQKDFFAEYFKTLQLNATI